MRVLLVEDDDSVADGIMDGLQNAAFEAHRVATGADALTAINSWAPDLILLDLGLPDMEGTDVCRAIRTTSQTPIIVVSTRGEEVDRVISLEMGADDYVVKPFGMRELVARIRAVVRRTVSTFAEPAPPCSARLWAIDDRCSRATCHAKWHGCSPHPERI